MRSNKSGIWGRVLIAVSAFLPVVWRYRAQDPWILTGYEQRTYAVGMISGLISYTLFASTFVLAWRFRRIESLFWGLDKMYLVHAIVGSIAFVTMLFHPLFLVVKYLPDQVYLAASYLMPWSHRSINFGITAFLLMILLMVLTLYIKRVRYNHRKASHTFFSVAFVFVALHVFLIKGSLAEIYFPGYYTYASVVTGVWIGTYIYTILLRRRRVPYIYTVTKVQEHAWAVTEIVMNPRSRAVTYKPWQFGFFKFTGKNVSTEAHPFSFASAVSEDGSIKIYAKQLWDYTKKLLHLRTGDRVKIEGPFGTFMINTSSSQKKVRIAAWIWITPFLAMAESLDSTFPYEIDLYYLVRHEDEMVWHALLEQKAKEVEKFRFIPRISRIQWRLDIADIERMSGVLPLCEWYLCGPTQMKSMFESSLSSAGVPSQQIISEGYSFKL